MASSAGRCQAYGRDQTGAMVGRLAYATQTRTHGATGARPAGLPAVSSPLSPVDGFEGWNGSRSLDPSRQQLFRLRETAGSKSAFEDREIIGNPPEVHTQMRAGEV